MKQISEIYKLTVMLNDGKPVAQVERMLRITEDDGTPLTTTFPPAEPLEMPLSAEILGEINAAALAENATIKTTHAAELAQLTADHATALTALQALESFRVAMVEKVTAVLQSGDPEQFAALALEFLTPEQEKIRAEKLAQLDALKAELGIE